MRKLWCLLLVFLLPISVYAQESAADVWNQNNKDEKLSQLMGFMGGLVFSAKILDQQEYDKATLQKFFTSLTERITTKESWGTFLALVDAYYSIPKNKDEAPFNAFLWALDQMKK